MPILIVSVYPMTCKFSTYPTIPRNIPNPNAINRINEFMSKAIGNTTTNKNESVDMGDGNSNEGI